MLNRFTRIYALHAKQRSDALRSKSYTQTLWEGELLAYEKCRQEYEQSGMADPSTQHFLNKWEQVLAHFSAEPLTLP